MGQKHILVVVGGEDTIVVIQDNTTLSDVREQALRNTLNLGRPFDEWELRGERGNPLTGELLAVDYLTSVGATNGCQVFLSLKIAAGGYLDMTLSRLEKTLITALLTEPPLSSEVVRRLAEDLNVPIKTITTEYSYLKARFRR